MAAPGPRLSDTNAKKLAMWSLKYDLPQQQIVDIIIEMTGEIVFERMCVDIQKPSVQRRRMKLVVTTKGGFSEP